MFFFTHFAQGSKADAVVCTVYDVYVSKTQHPINPTLAVWGIANLSKSVPNVHHLKLTVYR